MTKQCKCEHWQQCPVCMPHRFDADGNLKPPEPTPLQAAQANADYWKEEARRYAQNVDFWRTKAEQQQHEVEQEPVAWMVYTLNGKSVCITDSPEDFTDTHCALPLYTAPPQRKPLTEEKIRQIALDTPIGGTNFARAIERAHDIT